MRDSDNARDSFDNIHEQALTDYNNNNKKIQTFLSDKFFRTVIDKHLAEKQGSDTQSRKQSPHALN